MLLSRRGKRRLLVLALVALVVGAAGAAFVGIKRLQQQRMAAQARSDGLQAYREGYLQRAIDELSYYFQQEKQDLEVNLTFAEARSRVPLPGGRHLFDAVNLYTVHSLDLIDRTPGADQAQRFSVLQRLLELYAQLGDRERVASTAEALLKIDPDMIDALAARAEVYFGSREFEDARRLAQRLIELDPDSLTWRKMLLEVRARQGESTESQLEQCRQWSEQYTADARFRLLAAAMMVDAGRLDDARAELQSVSSLSANSRAVLEQLVALLDALGMSAEANAVLASTVERFPEQWWPREVAIERAWQRDEPQAALAQLADARAALSNEPASVRRLEVVALLAAGRLDDARRALAPLAEHVALNKAADADRAWAAAVASVLDGGNGQWRAAADAIRMALSATPNDVVLQFLLGDVCLRMGERSQAIGAYGRAYANAPNWSNAGVAYGQTLLEAGRITDAFDVAQLVVTRSGGDRLQPFLLYARCALALHDAGTPVELIGGGEIVRDLLDALEQVFAQQPDAPEVAALLVRAQLASDDREAALRVIEEAMQRDDLSAPTFVALAEVASAARLEVAEQLLHKARDIGGLTAPVAFGLADCLARKGQAAEGLNLIDQAAGAAADPEELRTIRCARAGYLLQTGAPEAIQALAAVVADFPDSLDVQRFALAQPQAWSDKRLVAHAMNNLQRVLGANSIQVRLAEANFLIQHQGRERAMLAKARDTIDGVLAETPDSMAALSLAADAAAMGEQPDLSRAVECLEHAVNLYPGEPSLLLRLIATLQRQGRFDAARRHLQSLSRVLDHRPEFVADELQLLQAQGEFETALVRAAAMVSDTSPPPQQLLLAAAQERTGRVAEAEQIYQRLLESHPNDRLVRAQAAEFFATTGRFQKGLELIQGMAVDDQSGGRELLVGAFLQRHGRVVEAGESLRAAVAADPKSADAHDELAKHYLSISQPMQARDQAMAGLRVDATHVGLRSTLAIANLALPGSDRAEAIRLLRDLGSTNDALLAMLELLERVPVVGGRAAPTQENLTRARQLTDAHGLFLPVWQMAIALHMEAGQRNDAIAIAREAVGRLPGQPQPSAWATQLLMQAGRWDDALSEAQEWRRRTLADPLAADAATARILVHRDRPDDALSILSPHEKSLLEERREFPERLITLIEALVRTGDIARAGAIIQPLLGEDTRWRLAWIAAAELMNQADAVKALEQMEASVQAAEERLALASAWLKIGQQSRSELHLGRAEALAQSLQHEAETSVGALITLGAIAEARTDLAAAERAYRAVLGLAPQNAVALNNLAFVLTLQQRHEEALPLIEQALKAQPDQPDFLDTYAMTLRGINRLEDAERAIRRALEGRPSDAAFMMSLADIQLDRGLRDDALLTYAQVQRRQASLNRPLVSRLKALKQRINAGAVPGPAPSASSGAANSTNPAVP